MKLLFTLFLAIFLTGCATTSLFTPYPAQIKPVKTAIAKGDFKTAGAAVSGKTDGEDKILYLMEYGRIQQLGGDYQGSLKSYGAAIDAVDINADKAKITVTGAGAQSGSILVNDNVIPYAGYAYEHIMLHQYQAINYLLLGQIDDALVEVRRAEQLQLTEQQQYQKELNSSNKLAKLNKIDNKLAAKDKRFAALNQIASQVSSQFLNAYAYYLGGLLYEASGDANSGYVDYKQALAIYPDNIYLQQTVLRLAKQLGMANDYSHYSQLYPQSVNSPAANQGELVVIFEQGFVPPRQEVSVPIPLPRAGIVPIAVPVYQGEVQPTTPLQISDVNGKRLGNTAVLVNLQSLAAKSLQQQYPMIILRETLRALAKAAIEYKAGHSGNSQNQANPLGSLIANMYVMATSKADLRSWLTLPNDAQIMQNYLPAGDQRITLNYNGSHQTVPVKIAAGRITLVWVVGYPDRFSANAFLL